MKFDPNACVRAIKKRLKAKKPDTLDFSMVSIARTVMRAKRMENRGYALLRTGHLVIVQFAAWNSMLPRVMELIEREEGLVCERHNHRLWVYPRDRPPSDALRRKLLP